MQALNERGAVLSFIVDWWRSWTSHRAAIDESSRSRADETGHVAPNVGASSPELRTLAGKWPDSADLLSQRIVAVGVRTENIATAEPQVPRDAQRDALRAEERNRRLMRRRHQWRSF